MIRSEFSKANSFGMRFSTLTVFLAVSCAMPVQAQLPTGGSIASGVATIQQNGAAMTIQQSSQKAALNWQSFNIGAGNSVNFVQPNAGSVALNRVLGNDASSIFGSLQANGSVFLINPNGVLFAPGAQVNVGGLVASTLGLSDADFAAGNYLFTNNGNAGSVINHGRIQAGNVALLGPQIVNSGTISASGSVALAAGDAITVKLLDSGLLTAHVDKAALTASIQNHGQIVANGGQVQLLADAIQDTLLNTDGLIQAKSLVNKEGHIYLSGGSNGTVTVSGTLNVSGSEAGAHGGEISVLGKQVGLMSGSKLDASGDASGGAVLVGGNWHGEGPEQNASATYMDSNASIHANGNGGQVVLWSNEYTGFFGNISAKGGSVETSSRDNLQAFGKVDAGSWLLDPTDVAIVAGSTNTNDTDAGGIWTPTTNTAQIGVTNINNDLNAGTSVTINTASAGAGTGNITQNTGATIGKTAGGDASLTMNAAGSITLGDSIASSAGQLAVTLNANGGAVSGSGASINTNGGLLTVNCASGSGTISNVISGAGGLTKTGAGTLTLTNQNTYSGGTTISAGTVIGKRGGGNTYTITPFGSGTIAIGTVGTAVVDDTPGSGYNVFSNEITGAGTVSYLGSSVNRLMSPATLSGFTGVVSIDQNVVQLYGANTTATLNVSSGATFSEWGAQGDSTFGALTGSGTVSGVPGGGGGILTIGNGNGSGTFSGIIQNGSGTVSLTKVGTGTQTLSGTNTYTGATTISAGTLQVGNGGTTGTLGPGAIIDNSNLTFNRSDVGYTVASVISGSGTITQVGTGTTTLSGNNTYTGATTVSAGTLQAGSTSAFGNNSAVTNNANLDLKGSSNSIGSLAGSGTVTNSSATAATLTAGGNNISTTFSGFIQDGMGTVSFAKVGTGTQILTGTNTYTGPTTINTNSTLQIGGSGSLGSATYAAGITNNGTLQYSSSVNQTLSGVISGTGDIVKDTGSGTLTLSGGNTYGGTTTVKVGTLAVTNNSGLGDTGGGTVVNSGATLDLQNVAVGAESVSLTGAALSTSTGTSSLAGPVTLTSGGTANVGTGAELTLSGVVSGSGGLVKNNPGTLVLTAANTYSGSTLVQGGTVAVTNNSALGTGGVSLRFAGSTLDLRNVTIANSIAANAGTLQASTGVNTVSGNVSGFTTLPVNVLDGVQLTMAGTITLITPLVKNGTGTLTLTGNNINAGATTINAGTLQVGNGGTTGKFGTGAVTVASGANLIFNRSDTVNLSTLASNAAGITGAGNVTALIGGGFTVDRPIALTGANSSILLEAGKNQLAGDASGGDITMTSPISTSATGTVTIFSGNANTAALDAQVGGATGATRYKTYGVSASSTNDAVAGTRNYYYRQQPGTLSISGLTATKTYDGLLDAATAIDGSAAIINSLIDGDTLSYSGLNLLSATFDNPHAGTRNINASFSGATPGYPVGGVTWSLSGYGTGNLAALFSGTITPKPITASINAVGKTYDGLTTTASTLTTPSGFIGNDNATGVSGFLLAFDDPNAGARNVVASGTGKLAGFTGAARGNVSGIGAGNEVAGLASDYTVPTPAAAAVISQAPLTITANNDAKIVTQSDMPGYNGASFSGFVHGETEANLGGSLSMTRSNAGTEAVGNYAGVLVPAGYSSSNYAISYANGEYKILPAQQLLLKLQNAINPYGTSPAYTVNSVQYLDAGGTAIQALTEMAHTGNTYTYSDSAGGSVTFTITPQGSVISNAGYLAVGNYALSGSDAGIKGNNFVGLNYVGNQSVRQIGLTPYGDGASKIYDGTIALTGATVGLTGRLAGDVVLAGGDGTFISKNAGTNLGYDLNNITLSGSDAGNYYLAAGGFSATNGLITPRSITANVTANDKVYDGATIATLTTVGLNGVLAGDTVALDTAGYSALFNDRNAGLNKAVTVSGLGLSGAEAGNYTLAQPSGLTANIMPRPLLLIPNAEMLPYTSLPLNTAIYSNLLSNYTVTGLVDGDTLSSLGLSLTGSMSFNGNNTNRLLNPGAYLLGPGTLLTSLTDGNYTIVFGNPLDNTLTIEPGLNPNLITAATFASSDVSVVRSQTNAQQQQLGTDPSEPQCLLSVEGGSMKLPEGVADNSRDRQQGACSANR